MARSETTLLSLISTRAAKALSLLAAVLLLSALAPAVALAEGPWADEKLQQLSEANEAAQAELEAAENAYAEADAGMEAARDSMNDALREKNKASSWLDDYKSALSAGDNETLERIRQEVASDLNIDEEDVTEGLLEGLADEAARAYEECVSEFNAALETLAEADEALSEAEKRALAAESDYLSYHALPEITLTFDLGGGTLGNETGTITRIAKEGDVVQLPDAPTLEGYTFKFWKGSEYAAGAEYTVEGEHAFAAEWEQNASSDEKTDSNKSGSDAKSKIPATGDDMSKVVIPLSVAAGVALIALIGAAIKRRRGKN